MATTKVTLPETVDLIHAWRAGVPLGRSLLVAVSGIDGSGKGFVSARLAEHCRGLGHRTAVINIDGWLRLPAERFRDTDPGGHFYRHAIRFDAMFSQLVLPLRDQRSIAVESDFAEETASSYRRERWEFDDIDVILLEGIYLLKSEFREHYDGSIWVECTFETALERAIARGQEGLEEKATIDAYRTIYFPAQERHFRLDHPKDHANALLLNDERLGDSVE
ncbi:uridine kinase [Planctomycetes bacterium Pan216]|uniref:Uridine kinase n=1 Tax=Kolteria novifilia TaxID=2527975 RepID=A0A518B4C3_9BACT|nr:uridine kinase [Planctomycetes bacterium Pan216]